MIDWTYIQVNFDWLGHVVEAIIMASIVGSAGMVIFERRIGVLIGLAFAAGHFHGREKRDYEISVHMPPPHLDGYFMWRWSWDQATDFWPVAIVMMVVSMLLYRRWAKAGLGLRRRKS
ncbi:hypothetical protein LP421_01715 (plasmid) [Rhizobium sp. RCAM05350]|nr:hypothetical protein LP421_01715 [Rhizobium sp. RCAM05350]